MTSVPNRRPLLSGNKLLGQLLLLSLLFTFSSCDLFKPAVTPDPDRNTRVDDRNRGNDDEGGELDPIQSRRVYDPETESLKTGCLPS